MCLNSPFPSSLLFLPLPILCQSAYLSALSVYLIIYSVVCLPVTFPIFPSHSEHVARCNSQRFPHLHIIPRSLQSLLLVIIIILYCEFDLFSTAAGHEQNL